MARSLLLDSGPLGLLCSSPLLPDVARCRAWLAGRLLASDRVFVPAVVDYEVRRELVRVGASAKLRELATLALPALEMGRADWLRAADLWARVRRLGLPTSDPHAPGADCPIGAQALDLAQGGDVAVIASNNVGHPARFPGVDARDWPSIT